MNFFDTGARRLLAVLAVGGVLQMEGAQPPGTLLLRSKEGKVEVLPPDTARTNWVACDTDQLLAARWRLRTRENSRATLQWPDLSVVTCNEMAEIEVLATPSKKESGLRLLKGILSFIHKDKPGNIRTITRSVAAGIKGTEYIIAVEDINGAERTTFSVIDGVVTLTNAFGGLELTNGQQAVVEFGQAPELRTAGFIANNLLQWAFYYPAVLDLQDLPLAPAEEQALAGSLAAYRSGDLLGALETYPAGRQPATDSERIYQAALLLAVGQAQKCRIALASLPDRGPGDRLWRLATALRQVIASVNREPNPSIVAPELPTELLAASYFEQSRALSDKSLRSALALARKAAASSPGFSFAWARVAELEFSFGRTGAASEALSKCLELSEANAQGLALRGFLLAARNRTKEAGEGFDRALAVDPALGNAWLGRGLIRIRRGDTWGGRADLMMAAAVEPRRSVLRSYLGKAIALSGDSPRALHELELAKRLDPADPTPWLYSALLNEESNRINDGIRDLERSVELNDNRRVYRSRERLDADRSVRLANLARLMNDADLGDIALSEAGRAVATDYADYSAHLFLANSFEAQRRASLSNLRFETPAISEYLIASLLGPASGSLLPQPITQLEYSSLLEQDGLGLIANTEYFSRGAWRHSSAQFGTFKGSSYSLEAEYVTDPGERVNQDVEIRQLEAKFKHDFTPNDSVFLRVFDFRANGGDTRQTFDENAIARHYRFDEEQSPAVVVGYHHQWSPESHTLLLAGRFEDVLETADPASGVLALDRQFGATNGLAPVEVRHNYESRVELYTAEVQQIAVVNRHSLIAGARLQTSAQHASSRVADPNGMFLILLGTNNPISVQKENASSFTGALYAYDYLRLSETFQLVGGLNFTHQQNPVNTGTAPTSSEQERQNRWSPKAGLVWSPTANMSVQAEYSRSLTGVGISESARLEPAHVAGLLQSFRDPIPVSLAGGVDGADVESAEILWKARFKDTYLTADWQHLDASKKRKLGLYLSNELDYDMDPSRGLIRERLKFQEESVAISAHQLAGSEWSFGVGYRLSWAQLERRLPEYPGLGVGGVEDETRWDGWLHRLNFSALYRHSSGIFGRAEAVWLAQVREHQGNSAPDDQFWQINLLAGCRFARQRGEVAVGVLNAAGGDYRLDPLNHHPDLPRARTFYARVLLHF